jgi:hypothetical protein
MLGMVNMQIAFLADVHADFEAIKVLLPQCVLPGKISGLSFKRYSYPFQSTVVEIRDLPILTVVGSVDILDTCVLKSAGIGLS